tara:strand:- start:267 stop:557 length:291 start_codon:yes stop_codon:yes gene_type:complete
MQKFLNIKGDADTSFEGNQLVAIEGIKTVRAATATATDTVIAYNDGTATTITTAATTDFNIQVEIQAAIKEALQTSWTNPVYDLTLTLTPTNVVNA